MRWSSAAEAEPRSAVMRSRVRQQIVRSPLEVRRAGDQPLVVGQQRPHRLAVLLLRARGDAERGRRVPHPFVPRQLQLAGGLLQVGIGLARAPGAADLVGQLEGEARQRRNDALLVVRHVVEQRARQEEGIVGGPAVLVDLAVDQRGRRRHRAAAARRHVAGAEIGVGVDLVHHHHADRVVDQGGGRRARQPAHFSRRRWRREARGGAGRRQVRGGARAGSSCARVFSPRPAPAG